MCFVCVGVHMSMLGSIPRDLSIVPASDLTCDPRKELWKEQERGWLVRVRPLTYTGPFALYTKVAYEATWAFEEVEAQSVGAGQESQQVGSRSGTRRLVPWVSLALGTSLALRARAASGGGGG